MVSALVILALTLTVATAQVSALLSAVVHLLHSKSLSKYLKLKLRLGPPKPTCGLGSARCQVQALECYTY